MNNKLLLIKGITLLYRESQLSAAHENSAQLVRQLISDIRLPEVTVGIDHERQIIQSLRGTAMYMCDMPLGTHLEENELLQRLKVDTNDDVDLFEAARMGIEPFMTEPELKRFTISIRNNLENHFKELKINEIVYGAANKLRFNRDKITDMRSFVSEINSQLEPFLVLGKQKDPAIIGEVDMSDLEAVADVYSQVKDQDNGLGLLRTGWQGINRMLDGGFRPGSQTVIGALQHNYKTGFSLTIFKQVALYNKPFMRDPSKKPLLLHISFEDSLLMNFQFLYNSLYENETGQQADLKDKTEAELAAYVYQRLAVNGYHTRFLHVNPQLWTYRDIFSKVIELEAEGYEIHLMMMDYLLKLPTTGCDMGPAGHDIRNLYERLYSFCAQRKIAFITPHQLSTDSKLLIREDRPDFVKQIEGKGYYAGSKQIDQVVDLEIYIHIVKVNNKSYLTIQRGKHRKRTITPQADLYCVLPFEDVGGILDDINGQDSTRKKPGGGPIGSGEETPFWDFENAA